VLVATKRGEYDLSDPEKGEENAYDLRDETNRAGREVAIIRRRVKRRHQQRVDEGLPNGGSRPFGFEADRITHRPEEVVLVKELVERFLVSGSINAVARDWNARGIKTVATIEHERFLAGERKTDRKPTTWSQGQVLKLLRSPRMAGLRQHGNKDGWPVLALDAAGEPIRAAWEPIIPVETWGASPGRSEEPVETMGAN
jgi:site-specific DNA recombinase